MNRNQSLKLHSLGCVTPPPKGSPYVHSGRKSALLSTAHTVDVSPSCAITASPSQAT